MDSGIPCNYSVHGTWQDWLFEESRRRFVIYFLICAGLAVKILMESKTIRGLPSCQYVVLL
jgi:hypothetical protein